MSSTSTEDIIETMAESEPPNYGTVDTSALVEEGLRHRRSKWYHGFLTKTRHSDLKFRNPFRNCLGKPRLFTGQNVGELIWDQTFPILLLERIKHLFKGKQ